MNVRDAMTAEPCCCTPSTKLSDVARMMADNDCGEIPVVAGDNDRQPVGVITDRDIVIRTLASGQNPMEKTAGDCMSQPVVTVTEDTELKECCDLMETHQIRRVPVVDAEGKLVGIVAQADIAIQASSHATAEMVKEVSRPSSSPN